MKKKLLNLLLVILLLVAIPGTLVLASDITGALYKMSITVSNNGTLANYVSTNGVISTPNLIAGGFLNSSANNCAVLDAADNDVPFMPGYTTNPWAFWVETIGADSYINYDLYTADTTGGSIAYFPSATGMIVADNSTIELGSDFEVNTVGWVDTDAGSDKYLVYKEKAFQTWISAADSITSGVLADTDFNPDAHVEVSSVDGFVEYADAAGLTWAVIHDADPGTIANDNGGTAAAVIRCDGNVDEFDQIWRGYILFDTAAIPDEATILTATLQVRGTNKLDMRPWGDSTLNVFSSDPLSNVALVVADYARVGNTPFATAIAYGDYDAAGWNTFTLNTAGIVAIDVAGISKFSIREATYEAPDIAPVWSNGDSLSYTFNCADAGGGNEPVLNVVYTVAEVIATPIASEEYTVTTTLNSTSYDFSAYSANTTIAVSMGGGLIPVFLLEEQELTAPAASVTFSNIDTLVANWDAYAGVTSRHLVVVVNAASPDAVSQRTLAVRFNGDVGNNYNSQFLRGRAAADDAARSTGVSFIECLAIPGAIYAGAWGGGTILVPHAFNTTNHKATISIGGAAEDNVRTTAGRWADTNAITTTLIYPSVGNFSAGSTFWLGVVDERYLVEEDLLLADGLPDFNAIPQDGSDLVVIGYLRSDRVAGSDSILRLINGDAVGGNYFNQFLRGTGGATGAFQTNNRIIGETLGDNAGANEFGAFLCFYSQYAETTNYPHELSLSGYHNSIPGADVIVGSARRNNVVAITRIQFDPNVGLNFIAGSLFSLYRVPRTVIDRQELAAPVATITFNNIPQGYEALQVLIYARTDVAALTDYATTEYNTDVVAANYDRQVLLGQGVAVISSRNGADRDTIRVSGANAGANEFSGGILTLPNYAKADRHKHTIWITGVNEDEVRIGSGRWEDVSAITRIDLTPTGGANWVAGSIFELVGIFPQDVFSIEIDGDLYGIADGNNVSVPDNGNDWEFFLNDAMPYMYSDRITAGSVLHAWHEWEYDSTFHDRSYYGLEFDGNDFVIVTDDASIDIGTSDFTIEVWINAPDTAGAFNNIMEKNAVAAPNYGLWLSNLGELYLEINDGSGLSAGSSTTAWDDNTWHYVVVTFDRDGNGTFYVDNTADGTVDISTRQLTLENAADLNIGRRSDGANFYNGVQDETHIYTRIMSAAEMTYNYNGGLGRYTPYSTDGLVLQLHIEEGSGAATADTSGEGNNGAITGATFANGIVPRPAGSSGTNDATPSFRTASSDPDVVATAISFQPVEEAKAPPWTLAEDTATWFTAANIVGNFTTTPSPTYPGASVIEDIAAASGTPAQLPFVMIWGFVTLAISLSVSYVLRQHGSRSIMVKVIIIGVVLWIGQAVGIIDFWMLLFFLLMGFAVMAASKPGSIT